MDRFWVTGVSKKGAFLSYYTSPAEKKFGPFSSANYKSAMADTEYNAK